MKQNEKILNFIPPTTTMNYFYSFSRASLCHPFLHFFQQMLGFSSTFDLVWPPWQKSLPLS